MKKYIPYILIAVLLVLGYHFYTKRDIDYKHKIELEKNKIDSINSVNEKLNVKIFDLIDSVKISEVALVNIEKEEEEAKKKIAKLRYSYSQLKKLVPENTKDSLDNYISRDSVLNKENESLNVALIKCDSAKSIQGTIITDLKEIISIKDVVISNKDTIIKSHERIENELVLEIESLENKNLLTKILGILLIIGALLV